MRFRGLLRLLSAHRLGGQVGVRLSELKLRLSLGQLFAIRLLRDDKTCLPTHCRQIGAPDFAESCLRSVVASSSFNVGPEALLPTGAAPRLDICRDLIGGADAAPERQDEPSRGSNTCTALS